MSTTFKELDGFKRTPAALLPYQQAWVADNAPVSFWEKSRRIGASWCEAAASALIAASQNGMNCFYIGYNKEMAVQFIHDAAEWAKYYKHAVSEITESEEVFKDGDESKSILVYTIRFESGWRIEALSGKPRSLRSKQGRIIVDEAGFNDDFDEVMKAALAMLIWGGRVRVLSTHDGDENEFNQYIKDIRAKKYDYSLHRTTFDEAVEQGLYRRVCLRTGQEYNKEGEAIWSTEIYKLYGDKSDEELRVIPANGSGSWLSRVLIEKRMKEGVPVLRFEQKDEFNTYSDDIRAAVTRDFINEVLMPELNKLPKNATSFVGEDFARSGDLSAYVPLIQQQNLTRTVPFILELKNIPHREQEQIMVALLSNLPNLAKGAFDGRGNGHYIAERAFQIFGSIIEIVMFTEDWYRRNMPPFKAALEDGTLDELPKDERVLSDLRHVKVIKGVAKVPDTKNVVNGEKRHADTFIALVLAFFASCEITLIPLKLKKAKPRRSKKLLRGY